MTSKKFTEILKEIEDTAVLYETLHKHNVKFNELSKEQKQECGAAMKLGTRRIKERAIQMLEAMMKEGEFKAAKEILDVDFDIVFGRTIQETDKRTIIIKREIIQTNDDKQQS